MGYKCYLEISLCVFNVVGIISRSHVRCRSRDKTGVSGEADLGRTPLRRIVYVTFLAELSRSAHKPHGYRKPALSDFFMVTIALFSTIANI